MKDTFVEKILQGTGSPFSPRVEEYWLPEKFKAHPMVNYRGIRDPVEHLGGFWVTCTPP